MYNTIILIDRFLNCSKISIIEMCRHSDARSVISGTQFLRCDCRINNNWMKETNSFSLI